VAEKKQSIVIDKFRRL